MRKGTKKNIIHGILIIFVIIFALMASLIAAFRDVTVQSMIARSLAGELSRKLNTNVKIRTFYITEKLTVRMEDVVFDDLDGYPMFKIGFLDAKLHPTMMTEEIKIKEVYLKDVLGRMVTYEGCDKMNLKAVMEQLGIKKNENSDSDLRLSIDRLKLDNGHVIVWNQNKYHPEKKGMDYAHLDIDSIYADMTDLAMRNDTVLGKVHRLTGKDRCGLVLDNAIGDVVFCEKSLTVDSLMAQINESHVDLDLRFDYDRSRAYYTFIDSVYIKGDIRQSTLLLSDLKYFSWILEQMPDKFVFTGQFDGTVSDFTVSNFVSDFGEESFIDADVSFNGLPHFFESYIDVNVRKMYSSYEDTRNFAIPSSSVTVPVPEMLACMGNYSLCGEFHGYPRDFQTQFDFGSEMGDINADVYLKTNEDPMYSFDIIGNAVQLDEIIGTNDGSEATFELVMNGEGLTKEETAFDADLYFNSLKLKDNEFNDFNVHSDYKNQKIKINTDIDHPYLGLALNSSIDMRGEMPLYDIDATINNADLVNLHLLDSDKVMLLSTDVSAEFRGNDIDNVTGVLNIKDTRYYNGEEYLMNNLDANISEISGIKDITVDCDFFDFYGYGIVHVKTLVNSLKNTAKRYVDMPEWFANTTPDTKDQMFSFNINFFDTRTLCKLLMPSLYIKSGTTVNLNYNNIYTSHSSTVMSPEIWFNGIRFDDLFIQNNASYDELTTHLSFKDIILRDSTEKNPDQIRIEDFKILAKCADNKINADLYWDDDEPEDANKAHIKALFTPHGTSGGKLNLSSNLIRINDTIWHLNPACCINFNKDGTDFRNLTLFTKTQRISINGEFPHHDSDTLVAEFNNFDISDLDFITKGNNLDFNGNLNGFVSISGLSENMSFSSNVDLKECYINGQEVGDVTAYAKWYDPNESVLLNMEVYNRQFDNNGRKSVGVFGTYFPRKKTDNLRLDMFFNGFKLETVSPFVSSVVTRMGGFASGNMKVRGSLTDPIVVGDVTLDNAGCRVNYLNTYYTFSDKVHLEENKILLNDVAIHDTLGNTAILNGVVNHSHLKDFNFDLTLRCQDFLALNIPAEQAQGFYGTAIADGIVKINGPLNDVSMTINALTKKGTEIDIPLSSTSSFENNFIVFVQKAKETDTVEEKYVPEVVKEDKNFTMDLSAGVNPDALVKIYLPQNMGNISSRGSGVVNIGLNNDDFELRGDYRINSGTFNFNLDVVKKTFLLQDGGTIRWTGDPADADINIVGVYHTKSSLNSLGTDLVDSTAITNNVNVDCIIRLSDKLTNPTITFGIDLPNAKEDTRNIVFSVIDTTNQAVMAQQVFSLMMLGSFSYTAGSNISRFGTSAGYGVITSQLSNMLSQLYEDLDVGINYTPNDNLTNEELEVALSTQLFDDRLVIEGNFGVIRGNRSDADNANNIVGDVDLTFRLTKRLSLKAYNHTNIKNNYYYYSIENYSDFTQGVGLSFSQSFDSLKEVFTLHRKNRKKQKTDESVPK